jgi:RNA polymerase sigma-70 factor (ECF subfamily)
MTTNPTIFALPTDLVRDAISGALRALRGTDAGAERSDEARSDDAHTEETRWVRAAQAGDPDAFRKLVERYRDPSYETALRIVRDREEAEEATQDAFVRAWRALPAFREDARFSTWLYRIVTRRAIDRVGALKRQRERETGVEPDVLERTAAPSTKATSLPDTSLRRLDRILAELDVVPRAAVTLYYLRERSVAEIAQILELPEGTVKTHLHRSRAALRHAWQRDERRERDHGLPRL